MQYIYDRIEDECGHFPMDSLPEKFAAFFRALDKEKTYKGTPLANASKNLFVRLVKRICNYCYVHGRIDTHPLRMLTTYKTTFREVHLPSEIQESLLKACKKKVPWLYEALWFSLRNPIRRSDIFDLTVDNLDINNHQIRYRSQKSDTFSCTIIFPEQEKYFNRRLKDTECKYLFYRTDRSGQHCKIASFRKSWVTVKKEAVRRLEAAKGLDPALKEKILQLRWHDLRHVSCMYLLGNFIPKNNIKTIGNWRSSAMIDLYSRSDASIAASDTRERLIKQELTSKKCKPARSTRGRRKRGRDNG